MGLFEAGVDKNKTDVQNILKDLNIQLDNLCQVSVSTLKLCHCPVHRGMHIYLKNYTRAGNRCSM